MSSLKRPSSSGLVSSMRRSTGPDRTLSTQPQPQLQSEDLFCSSSEENDTFQSSRNKKVSSKAKKEEANVLKDGTLFCSTITKAGMLLHTANLPNVLRCDQMTFQRSISKSLSNSSSLAGGSSQGCGEQGKELLAGLEKYLKLPHRLKWSLLFTETAPDCEVTAKGHQDSLIRLLLNVDVLQPALVTMLTDTLLTLAYEQSDGSSDARSLPSLVLGNLRWLDHVVEPEQLADAVLLVLQAATPQVQQEVVNFVPNIVTDDYHARTADVLTELLESTPCLTPSILDALLLLCLDEGRVAEVQHTVLRGLQATAPAHLPCVVRFLLHNTPPAAAYQVLCHVRKKLHVPPEREVTATNTVSNSQASPGSGEQQQQQATTNTEHADISVLLFSTVRTALLLHKYLTNAWLKAIDDCDAGSLRGVDLLVLVVVYEAVTARRQAVLSILRNKIRAGLRYESLLLATLQQHPALVREYFDSFRRLAVLMIRSSEPAVLQFGEALYRNLFSCSTGSSNANQQQQQVVVSLLAHLGDDQHVRLAALAVLARLTHQHTQLVARFAIFLKSSLEQLDRLSLQESRCLLDAVSAVAASDPNTALHADLAIHTRKLLNNSDLRYKRLGVLSAVLTLKNASSSSSLDDSHNTSSSCSDPPAGGEDLLDVVWACTAHCPSASALFMDELASIILRTGINPRLERLLSGRLEEQFESVFIQDLEDDATTLVTKLTKLPLVLSFELEEEDRAVIAVNIGELTERLEQQRRDTSVKPAHDDQQSVLLTLAPHFRLLRMVVSHLNNGDLSAIDALLGCPVYYPQPDLLLPAAFSALNNEQQTVLLSCLFFTANWFRELINAFVTQKTAELKMKVYGRLRNLLSVEQSLSALLPLCPGYQPHLAASHIDPSTAAPPPPPAAAALPAGGAAKKKGRKGKQSKKSKPSSEPAVDVTAGVTQLSQVPPSLAVTQQPSDTQQPCQQDDATMVTDAAQPKMADLGLYTCYLRELHLDVFSLLFKTMSLDTELQNASNQLSVPEAKFLLTDLNLKLSHVFGVTKRTFALGQAGPDGDAGYWNLDLFEAEEVAAQAQRFVKPLCVHLDNITKFFNSLIEDHDGVLDCSGVLNERTLPVSDVQGRLLTALIHLLAWPALHTHPNLYTGMLRVICRKQWPERSMEQVQELSAEQLLWGAFCYARRQMHSLLELGSGVLVVRLLEAVVDLAELVLGGNVPHIPDDDDEGKHQEGGDGPTSYGHKLGCVIRQLLQRNWTTASEGLPDKGALYNQRLATLLQVWLKHSPRPLSVIQELVSHGLDEYSSAATTAPGQQHQASTTFPTLNKGSLVTFQSCLLSSLSSSVKRSLATAAREEGGAPLTSQQERAASLAVWSTAGEIYSKLFRLVKLHHSRTQLSAGLKYARPFLELFLSLGMPLMDSCLESHKEEVCKLLKTLQTATRIMQIVCTEAKVKKDLNLTSHVPLTRRAMATLVFRVKAMLVHHNCPQAFWMGVLRNRNLAGEIISTQAEPEDDTNGERDDDAPHDTASNRSSADDDNDDEDSPLEDVELEDDRHSDVDLDDEDTSDDVASARRGRKRKSDEEALDEEEVLDGITDYSASF